MTNAVKNAKNPHFKSNYADLAAVRDIVVPALSAHGVCVVQGLQASAIEDSATVITTLYFGAEVMEVSRVTVSLAGERNKAQGIGKISSYIRRYSLAALGGIGQEDSDAETRGPAPPHARQNQPTKAQRLAQEQLAKVRQILHKEVGCAGEEDADAVIRWVTGGCWSLKTMSQDPGDVLAALQERNDSNPPYEFMLSAATEAGRSEAAKDSTSWLRTNGGHSMTEEEAEDLKKEQDDPNAHLYESLHLGK